MSRSGAVDAGPASSSSILRGVLADARHYQIAALGVLLVVNITALDLGAGLSPSMLAIGSALATQAACSRIWRQPRLDLRSPLITGLSLSLLLRADEPWVYVAAGIIAISSKFLLRLESKHLWNSAGLASYSSAPITSGFRRVSGAPASGLPRCSRFSRFWCCRQRGGRTSRCTFSAPMRRCCSLAPSGSAIPWRFRCISSRAGHCCSSLSS